MKGRKLRHRLTALLLAFAMIFTAVAVQPNCDAFAATKVKTPVATHGRLSVKGADLVDAKGKALTISFSSFLFLSVQKKTARKQSFSTCF